MRVVDRVGTIIVTLCGDRELLFRFLTINDEGFLQTLVREGPAPRDFTLQVLKNQLLDTSPTQLEDLGDSDLAAAAFSWADQDQDFDEVPTSTTSSLENFKRLVVEHMQDWEERQREFIRRNFPGVRVDQMRLLQGGFHLSPYVIESANTAVDRLSGRWGLIRETVLASRVQTDAAYRLIQHPQVMGAIVAYAEQAKYLRTAMIPILPNFEKLQRYLDKAFPVADLVRRLPGAGGIIAAWEDAKHRIQLGEIALQEEEFGFAVPLANPSLLSNLAGTPDQLKGAQATNKFLRFTRSEDFAVTLGERVTSSDVVARRWRIIEPMLAAHCGRNYALSIPALFAQVEGLFTDSMILSGLATIQGGKVLAQKPDGFLKLDKHNKPVELNGLGHKVRHSPYQGHDTLQEVASALLEFLTRRRNAVLHGNDVLYGKAKLSTQLILLVFILTTEILAFEQARVSL
jgi:hypothetical protein